MKEFVLENPPRKRRRRARSSSRRRGTARRRTRSTPRRRRRSRTVARSSRRRRSTSVRRTARRRRRSSRIIRGTFVKINPMNIKSVLGKDTVMIAAGAVASSVASNLLIGRLGRFLPGVMSPFGRAAYNVLLPLGVAVALSKLKVSPNLGKGLVIGGLANGIGQLLTATRVLPAGTVISAAPSAPSLPPPPATPGINSTGEYLGESMGEYLGAAFSTDAWS